MLATVECAVDAGAAPQAVEAGAVEFDRVIPPSGNLWAMGRQVWLGPARAGQIVRIWAGLDVIHLTIAGARIKSLRSHLSTADLAQLVSDGASPAGPPPLPPAEDDAAIEVDRAVNKAGLVSLAGRQVLATGILGGRPVIVRIEANTLMFLDPDARELLRTRPNPLTAAQARRLQGARPAGPPPRPRSEPVTVQRRVSATGVITVCRQHVALGRVHAGRTAPSTSPSTRSRSSSTTKPARSAAQPTDPSSSSRPTGHTGPGQRQQNSLPARRRQRRITNREDHEPHDPYET